MDPESEKTVGSDTDQERSTLQMDRTMEREEDLGIQLAQLQDLVHEMKEGFSTAVKALSDIQYGDQCLQQKLEHNKTEYEQQLTGVVQMVLSLKNEFGSVVGQLQIANESQRNLQQQVEYLQYERDILLDELEKGGAITNVRSRCQSRLTTHDQSQHNASLSLLLEKTHSAFNTQLTSDQDSGVTTGQHGDLSSCDDIPLHHTFSPMVPPFIAALPDQHVPPQDDDYDSDSSLTAAANKSLDLSRSLGDQCGDFTQSDSSEEEEVVSVSQHEARPVDLQNTSLLEPPYETSSPKKQNITRVASPRIASPRVASAKKMAPHERSMKDTQRSRVAREILETERKYCASLWTVIDTFAEPIKNSGFVSAKDYSIMFPMSLNRIYEHHCNLLHKLEDRMLHWQWQGLLGDIFARFTDTNNVDLLKLYSKYANEFPLVLNQIKKSCRQSNKFRKLLRKLQVQACGGLDLPSFMLTPIQRIPRYVLLLKQLLKHTESSHPDYYYVESSLEKLGHFLHQLNDSIEFSMKAVSAAANSPKGVKRKLRQLSMRSNGSSTTTDPNQLSSATRDSGILSNGEEQLAISHNSRTDARFAVSHDRRSPYGDSALYQDPSSFCQATPSHYAIMGNHDYLSYSLPYPSKGRRKVKVKRSHSSKLLPENIGPVKGGCEPGKIPMIQMEGSDPLDQSHLSVNSSRSGKVRSLVDQTSGASLESQASSSSAYSSMPDHNSSCDSAPMHSRSPLGAEKYSLTVKQENRSGLTKSMPRIPKDYGVYGDSNEHVDNTRYYNTLADGSTSARRAQKLSLEQRSKSQGDILKSEPDSPTQQQINLSLVRSLTQDILTPPGDSQESERFTRSVPRLCKDRSETTDQTDGINKGRVTQEFNADVSVADSSVLNMSDLGTLKRKEMKKRKKEKQKKPAESLDESKYKKGAVLRDSLRKIFGKRNSSKVVEIGSVKTIGFSSQDESHGQTESSARKLQNRSTEGTVVTTVHPEQTDFTYEDEDGDPCSNV